MEMLEVVERKETRARLDQNSDKLILITQGWPASLKSSGG